jgi:predicted nucleotidyltransferase
VLAGRVGRAPDALPFVRVVFVFGSRTTGTAHADSDLDVAVAFDPSLDDYGAFEAKRDVLDALANALGALGERADIVDLRRDGSAIAFRAIRDGVLALSRSDAERVELVTKIVRRYDDDGPRRALFRDAAIRAARGGARG